MPQNSAWRWLPRILHGVLGVFAVCFGSPVSAHEFWLESIQYRPAVGASVPIVQRTGSEFAGLSYPYLKEDTRRFSVIGPGGETPIEAVEGDDPAAEVKFTRPGLTRVVYQGALNEVVFDTFAKFEESLKFEHLAFIAAEHRAAGKQESGIRERYFRCAKALIAVGGGDGSDTPVGLPLELIAEANPYLLEVGKPLPVRLEYEGNPLSGRTIKVFDHDKPASPRNFVTDSDGRILIGLPKRGEYMVHTVHMREPRAGETGHWVSLWASLTFLRP